MFFLFSGEDEQDGGLVGLGGLVVHLGDHLGNQDALVELDGLGELVREVLIDVGAIQ